LKLWRCTSEKTTAQTAEREPRLVGQASRCVRPRTVLLKNAGLQASLFEPLRPAPVRTLNPNTCANTQVLERALWGWCGLHVALWPITWKAMRFDNHHDGLQEQRSRPLRPRRRIFSPVLCCVPFIMRPCRRDPHGIAMLGGGFLFNRYVHQCAHPRLSDLLCRP
jgi:hypothetical protein